MIIANINPLVQKVLIMQKSHKFDFCNFMLTLQLHSKIKPNFHF